MHIYAFYLKKMARFFKIAPIDSLRRQLLGSKDQVISARAYVRFCGCIGPLLKQQSTDQRIKKNRSTSLSVRVISFIQNLTGNDFHHLGTRDSHWLLTKSLKGKIQYTLILTLLEFYQHLPMARFMPACKNYLCPGVQLIDQKDIQ